MKPDTEDDWTGQNCPEGRPNGLSSGNYQLIVGPDVSLETMMTS